MEIWIVLLPFSSGVLSDDTYRQCLEQLDVSSQNRVKRFFHREDSWRSLTGMLLPRAFLREQGIPLESVTFSRTEAGKPFVVNPHKFLYEHVSNLTKDVPRFTPAIGYNISHDNQMVAMVSHLGGEKDIHNVGIDVMKRALPKGETVSSFLRVIGETLTKAELNIFASGLDSVTAIRYIFLFWTLKEAYTKALGMGLGFDFKRIEYNITQSCVFVDGSPAKGWEFLLFVMQGQGTTDIYQGAVARRVGGELAQMEFISNVEDDSRFRLRGITDLIVGT